MAQEIQVAIVEDQWLAREGLASLIGGTPGFRVTGRFGTMEAALAALERTTAHVVLQDLAPPSGIESLRRLRTRHPALQVLVLTALGDDEHVFGAICAGASGYLLKDTPPARLLEAIREVHGGGAPMSPGIARRVLGMLQVLAPRPGSAHRLSAREVDVLRLLTEGHSYKTAADRLQLSLDTVRFHVRNIYEKLQVHSKSEAVLAAVRRRIC